MPNGVLCFVCPAFDSKSIVPAGWCRTCKERERKQRKRAEARRRKGDATVELRRVRFAPGGERESEARFQAFVERRKEYWKARIAAILAL